MEQKYKLGEDVEIQLRGRITEVALQDEMPVYTIEGANAYARRVNESQIIPLFIVREKI